MFRCSIFASILGIVCVLSGCTNAPLPDDPNAGGGDMRNELVMAIGNGDVEKVRQLLTAQPLLANAPHPSTGQPPIHLAASKPNADIIRALLESGADPYVLNDEGEAAIDIARRSGASDDVLALLQ
jgi:ankyrin repeat protein